MHGYMGQQVPTALATAGRVVGKVEQAAGTACQVMGYVPKDEVNRAWMFGLGIGALVGWAVLPAVFGGRRMKNPRRKRRRRRRR